MGQNDLIAQFFQSWIRQIGWFETSCKAEKQV